MDPNLALSHLHMYHNFLSQLHYTMLIETIVLNKKTLHLYYQVQKSENRVEWIEVYYMKLLFTMKIKLEHLFLTQNQTKMERNT